MNIRVYYKLAGSKNMDNFDKLKIIHVDYIVLYYRQQKIISSCVSVITSIKNIITIHVFL